MNEKNKIDKNKNQIERSRLALDGADNIYAIYFRNTGELVYNINFKGESKIIIFENDVSDVI